MPRALLAGELLIAGTGPANWLAVAYLPGDASFPNLSQAARELLALFIVFGALPRLVFGPVLLAIEGATSLLVRECVTRRLLGAAMLMDLVPLSVFTLHLLRAIVI